eukprot:3620772-Rhodomonas_salina.1
MRSVDDKEEIVECVPCSRCIAADIAPPGFFSRDHLILALYQINTLLTGQTMCCLLYTSDAADDM